VSFGTNEGYGDSADHSNSGSSPKEVNQDPRLVILGADGLPTTVRYDLLSADLG